MPFTHVCFKILYSTVVQKYLGSFCEDYIMQKNAPKSPGALGTPPLSSVFFRAGDIILTPLSG